MKISILTYGCAANQADSEAMAGLLKEVGFDVSFGEDPKSDLLIVNTCIVKGPTENKIIRKLQDLSKAGRKVIVAGCMYEAYPDVAKKFPDFLFMGTNPVDVVEAVSDVAREPVKRLAIKPLRTNPFIEIIPISQGCLGRCAYCSVKLARGNLRSYTTKDIVAKVKAAVADGVKEVWLTSQDNGCYGLDIGTNLAGLLKLVAAVPGDFKVRVGMMNPGHVIPFLDELIEVFKDEKIYNFIHVPVQSGSDAVLKRMRRGYTTKQFKEIVSRFRKAMDMNISTDIIVAFPGETDADLKKTLNLLEETKPDVLNLSKYWKRRGTEAYDMEQVPLAVSKERGKAVAELFSKLSKGKDKKWLGWTGEILLTDSKNGYLVGRNQQYKPVLVKRDKDLLGKICSVRITDVSKGDYKGERVAPISS